jgi:hypothetical protein
MPPGAGSRPIRSSLIAVLATASAVLAGCAGAHRDAPPALSYAADRPVPDASCAPEPLAHAPLAQEVGVYRAGPLILAVGEDLAQHPQQRPGRWTSGSEAIAVLNSAHNVVLSVDPAWRARFSLQFTPDGRGHPYPVLTDGRPAVQFPACPGRVHRFGGGVLFKGAGCVRLHVKQSGRPAIPMLIPIGDTLRDCANPIRPLGAGVVPFLGVSCPVPNSITCDRLGIGVHLNPNATLVVVQLDGRLVTLSPPTDQPDNLWLGYLDGAGLRHGPLDVHIPPSSHLWSGTPEVHPRVRLTAFFADGHTASLTTTVLLHPGFG